VGYQWSKIMGKDWKQARFCSARALLFQQLLKRNKRFWDGRGEIPVALARERLNKLASRVPKLPMKVDCSVQMIGSLAIHWFLPPDRAKNRVVLYLHGGAYMACSPMTTHRELISRLAICTGQTFVAVNYRKAPENPFPAALEYCSKAYRWLLEKYNADQVSVMGDSAGGGLVLALVLLLRDEGLPLPAKIVALSPLADLAGTGQSLQQNRDTDAMVPVWLINQVANLYCGGKELTQPYISHLYGDFHGFPDTLIQVSDSEVLFDDSRRLADKMRAARVPVQLDIWHKLPHVWQAFAAVIPEGRAAINDIARLLRS
jgi:epsilon-lactone hydrolase